MPRVNTTLLSHHLYLEAFICLYRTGNTQTAQQKAGRGQSPAGFFFVPRLLAQIQ